MRKVRALLKFGVAVPFVGAACLLTGDRRPYIQGVMTGAVCLCLALGYVNHRDGHVPVTLEYIQKLAQAQSQSETIWSEHVELSGLGLGDDPLPDFGAPPPIPQRKPKRDGYTHDERMAMNNLIQQTYEGE